MPCRHPPEHVVPPASGSSLAWPTTAVDASEIAPLAVMRSPRASVVGYACIRPPLWVSRRANEPWTARSQPVAQTDCSHSTPCSASGPTNSSTVHHTQNDYVNDVPDVDCSAGGGLGRGHAGRQGSAGPAPAHRHRRTPRAHRPRSSRYRENLTRSIRAPDRTTAGSPATALPSRPQTAAPGIRARRPAFPPTLSRGSISHPSVCLFPVAWTPMRAYVPGSEPRWQGSSHPKGNR